MSESPRANPAAVRGRRVLLICPTLPTMIIRNRPHLGLGILATKLDDAGFEVKILDYILAPDNPPLAEVVDTFNPDIAGITIMTPFWKQADAMLDELCRRPEIIKIVGGPHATLYHDDLVRDSRIHYIFRGESEENILDICRSAEPLNPPAVIEPSRPELSRLPFPSFNLSLNSDRILEYPLQTSRGCPFGCIFCEISSISSKKWRPRPLEQILLELDAAAQKYPNVRIIEIVDDNPTYDRERFKEFLRGYMKYKDRWDLRVDAVRADSIDAEMANLMVAANCKSLCIAVEHGDPAIFKSINKGETLPQIIDAARIVRESGMMMGFSFVIGLPGDSFEKTKMSVRFASRNKSAFNFWNILVPHRGTKVREWIEKHGRMGDERGFSLTLDDRIYCDPPVFDTDSFPKQDIVKAHFFAVLATNGYRLTKRNIAYVILTALRYGFIKALMGSLAKQFRSRLSGG